MKMMKKIVLGFVAVSTLGFAAFKTDDRLFEMAKNLEIFATLYKELNSLYVDEINPTATMRIGIQAMLKNLDPYTVFYPEDEIEDYMTMNTGSYNGIGATIEHIEGKHTVIMLYEGSPADKAGIKIGDEIQKINGQELSKRNDVEFGRLLKGQKGTQVKLNVYRAILDKKLEMSVQRDIVKTPNVPHFGILKDHIGYIQLTEFTGSASKEVKSAFVDLKDKGMKKLILDLRGNPGGLLQMAIEICNFFIPKGQLVVETKGKVKEWNHKYNTLLAPLDLEIPIVVLLNGRSASASEIVGGTLQDYDRAVLVGGRSYGKGLVQVTKPLAYNTSFKVTTSKYYIPSGRCIQAIDYANKGVNGVANKLPDSLRAAFTTKAGRKVLDGAGVDPDIDTHQEAVPEMVKGIIKERLIFRYANEYYFKNTDKKPPEDFSLSTAEMAIFEAWLEKQPIKYKTNDQKNILASIASTKESGEYAKNKTLFDELQKNIDKNAGEQLKKYSKTIRKELEMEILERYYYQKASKFMAYEKDEDIISAIKILNEPAKYNSLLGKKP